MARGYIEESLQEIAKKEYNKSLKILKREVGQALKTNPHNKWEGSTMEYIRCFNLDKILATRIYNRYMNNKTDEEKIKKQWRQW